MPQLMPFLWVSSVFMSFMLLLVLVFLYNYVKDYSFNSMMMKKGMYFVKW